MSNNYALRLGRAKTWLEAFWGKKIMIFRILLVLGLSKFICGNVYAKEPFNIKGIQIGDTIDTLKKVFPEIKIKSQTNIAHCKNENFVIQNGSTFIAVREEERRKYSFQLIFVNGVQIVTRAKFSYISTSVSRELFLARVNEKYDISVINEENILKARYSMDDYAGISHFVVPEGHFFKISEKDIFRLKYTSTIPNHIKAGNLVHTIIIESKKYNDLDENQRELGKEERIQIEKECGKIELQTLDF